MRRIKSHLRSLLTLPAPRYEKPPFSPHTTIMTERLSQPTCNNLQVYFDSIARDPARRGSSHTTTSSCRIFITTINWHLRATWELISTVSNASWEQIYKNTSQEDGMVWIAAVRHKTRCSKLRMGIWQAVVAMRVERFQANEIGLNCKFAVLYHIVYLGTLTEGLRCTISPFLTPHAWFPPLPNLSNLLGPGISPVMVHHRLWYITGYGTWPVKYYINFGNIDITLCQIPPLYFFISLTYGNSIRILFDYLVISLTLRKNFYIYNRLSIRNR